MALFDGSVLMSSLMSPKISSFPLPIESFDALRAVPPKLSPTGTALAAAGAAAGDAPIGGTAERGIGTS
jgi:hypothetical protein